MVYVCMYVLSAPGDFSVLKASSTAQKHKKHKKHRQHEQALNIILEIGCLYVRPTDKDYTILKCEYSWNLMCPLVTFEK